MSYFKAPNTPGRATHAEALTWMYPLSIRMDGHSHSRQNRILHFTVKITHMKS